MTQVTESELLYEANEIYTQKKTTAHHQNVISTETSKIQKIPKSSLNRLRDYYLYKGDGWTAKNPLNIDKNSKTYDKVSPIFIKFLQVVKDLRAVGELNFLSPYLTALETEGIKIYIDPGKVEVSDPVETLSSINSMGSLQKQINELDRQIKEDKALEAEDINFTKKSEFGKLVAFYNKKTEKGTEAVEDSYHDTIETHELIESSYTKVFDESLT